MPASNKTSNPTSPAKKAAWHDAPLPQFYDLEIAQLMVKQGTYPSIDEAYIDVPETKRKHVREQAEEYLMNCISSLFWQKSPLPSPKK